MSSIVALGTLMVVSCSQPNDDLTSELPHQVSYNSHIQVILEKSCVRCHGGTVTHGIDFSSYSKILESVGNDPSEDIIVIGNAQSKILRSKLNPEYGPMYKYLSDPLEYDMIYKWIVEDNLAENL
ncbi:MAG: hypothetical protein H8E18_13670 [FCB group bacterium]|nr:hypothetical protein [FCB group bacterium]